MHEYRRVMAQQRARELRAIVLTIIVLALCVGAGLSVYINFRSAPEAAPTPTSTSVVVAPSPTTMATTVASPPPSTSPPMSTETPLPTATSTVLPSPTSPPPSDPQNDVTTYDTGDPIGDASPGLDIRTASVGIDLRVALQSTAETPAELTEWVAEDEMLLWLSLHGPVPDPPPAFTDWVFVLDLDGDEATGRPAGTVRANPDLGYEAAVGVSYNGTSGQYEPYVLVWDPARSTLVTASDPPRFILNETRTLIGLALPLETLVETVEQTAGVTWAPGAVKGRVAAQSVVAGRKVIDVYPEVPD